MCVPITDTASFERGGPVGNSTQLVASVRDDAVQTGYRISVDFSTHGLYYSTTSALVQDLSIRIDVAPRSDAQGARAVIQVGVSMVEFADSNALTHPIYSTESEHVTSNLANLSPIKVCGESLPTPHVFDNIPMLHRIMEEVLEDWLRVVEPYQDQIDTSSDEGSKTFAVTSGLMELQPFMLKCLFSYAFFFVAADNAYAYFYRELNRANNLLGLRLKHGKPPKKSSLVTKINTIRDIAIAHFPSEKAEPHRRFRCYVLAADVIVI